jgi:hypothetical protein
MFLEYQKLGSWNTGFEFLEFLEKSLKFTKMSQKVTKVKLKAMES